MRMLMPSHAKNVKAYKDTQPLFSRYGIESQLDAMFTPVTQLRSGGYIVLNQTEALVSIDVNSGRATREHHIEDTALKTNLEAAEEIARQLRLRDLAGLIVIDFIDMDEKRNNRAVERRLKECLKHDRARIQVGRISHFGLLEMSRQRIRTSVLESSTETCTHCGGTGHVRSVSSVALQLLRVLEETVLRGPTHNLIVRTRSEVALYVLNHKRAHLRELEARFRLTLTVNADPTIGGQQPFVIEKGEQVHTLEQAKALAAQPMSVVPTAEDDEAEDEFEDIDGEEVFAEAPHGELEPSEHEHGERSDSGEHGEPGEGPGRRRRRRRRRGRRGGEGREQGGVAREITAEPNVAHEDDEEGDGEDASEPAGGQAEAHEAGGPNGGENGEHRRRRRGRRGGRRNRRHREGEAPLAGSDAAASVEAEARSAVADFDLTPPDGPAYVEPGDAAAPVEAERMRDEPVPTAGASEAETPPRRSTVRERAPMPGDDNAAASAEQEQEQEPAPAPALKVSGGEESDQPPRSGWWSRRFAGGDKG
jgi:ribonuclease E